MFLKQAKVKIFCGAGGGSKKLKLFMIDFWFFPYLYRVYFIKFDDYSYIHTEELNLTIYVLCFGLHT